jgi:hypothetical protein
MFSRCDLFQLQAAGEAKNKSEAEYPPLETVTKQRQ